MNAPNKASDKPAVSERKRNANIANAQKSTGPKTQAGKERSRMNALTHGLRAEQVVLPDEDAAAFSAERDAFFDQWKPADPTEASFVERLAAGSWRLRRCIRVESARYTTLCQDAAKAFDDIASGRRDADLRLFTVDPARGIDALMEYGAGVEQLYLRWVRIADALRFPGDYCDPVRHHNVLCRLRGLDPAAPPTTDEVALASWQLIVSCNPSVLRGMPWDDADGRLAEPFTDEQAVRMRAVLLGMAEKKIESLLAMFDELPDTRSDRTRYIEAHCVDASREGLTLMRYEGMHDRSFRANVAQLIKLKKFGPELIEIIEGAPSAPNEPTHAARKDESAAPQARSGEPDPPNGPTEGEPEPPAPNEPTGGRPGSTFAKAERDRDGRIWPVVGPDGPPTR